MTYEEWDTWRREQWPFAAHFRWHSMVRPRHGSPRTVAQWIRGFNG